jgi:hypothetical protein
MEVIDLIQYVRENGTRFGAHMSHTVLFARSGDQMKSKDAVPVDLQDPQNVAQIVEISKLHSTFDPRSSIIIIDLPLEPLEPLDPLYYEPWLSRG